MTRFWTRRLAAILALLTFTVGARSSAAWYCEGRVCGTTPWDCCCAVDSGTCDLPGELRSRAPVTASAGCATACSCVMVERATDQILASRQTIPLLDMTVGVLPVVETSVEIRPDRPIYVMEPRGPPLLRRSPLPLGLRAPPSA